MDVEAKGRALSEGIGGSMWITELVIAVVLLLGFYSLEERLKDIIVVRGSSSLGALEVVCG